MSLVAFALSLSAHAAVEIAPTPAPAPEGPAPEVDVRALVERATDGLERRERRAVASEVRRTAVHDLVTSIAETPGHAVRVEASEEREVWRFLDDRGRVDWLVLQVGPSGRVQDWSWVSSGRPASQWLAERTLGEPAPERTDLMAPAFVGDWTTFEATLDRIEGVVGEDPWLGWLRGVAADAQGRRAEARVRMAVAVALDPTLADQALIR